MLLEVDPFARTTRSRAAGRAVQLDRNRAAVARVRLLGRARLLGDLRQYPSFESGLELFHDFKDILTVEPSRWPKKAPTAYEGFEALQPWWKIACFAKC
jgi:hypothetical protein